MRTFTGYLLLAALLLLGFSGAGAQEPSDTVRPALLEKGPYLRKGLEFFPRDLSSFYYGQYIINEDIWLAVSYTIDFNADDLPDTWKPYRMAGMSFLAPVPEGRELPVLFFRQFSSGTGLFYEIHGSEPESDAYPERLLRFFPVFEERFSYLIQVRTKEIMIPFPSVLEY